MFRVFYSWASDAPVRRNRLRIVFPAIKDTLSRICAANGVEWEIDHCGRFRGATAIFDYIVEALSQCHAHVVDVSLINEPGEPKTRRTPNPNNMFEFGLSLRSLGRGNIVLVFDEQTGAVDQLPFDLRHLSVVVFDSRAPNARQRLARELDPAMEGSVKDYVGMVSGLCRDLNRSLGQLIPFFRDFLRAHEANEQLVKSSLNVLEPDVNRTSYPYEEYLADLMQQFHKNALCSPAEHSGSGNRPWASVFGVLLQRLVNDSKRMQYRYQKLRGIVLDERVATIGSEAEHLKNLFDRIVSDVPDMITDEAIVEDISMFLRHFIDARREVARFRGEGIHPG